MEVRNHTPFEILTFNSLTPSGEEFGVLVLRGTFVIKPGAVLWPCPEQDPIVEADEYYVQPNMSSLRLASDLVPEKTRTDVHIDAVARAPRNKPAREWLVGVRIGTPAEYPKEKYRLAKYLRVTVPRQWEYRNGYGWQLTEASEPVMEVPIRYENAFGGFYETDTGLIACQYNPIGVGFFDPASAPRDKPIPAPQIEAAINGDVHEITEPGKFYPPQGLGPIPPGWQPRRKHAGTFDDAWRKERWPELPLDHEPEHYNSAHPDLIYPGYLTGNETIELIGIMPLQKLIFHLPGYLVTVLLRAQNGQPSYAPLMLDTVNLSLASEDMAEWRVHLVWRRRYRLDPPLRVLEARME